jgi:hypothetical protein
MRSSVPAPDTPGAPSPAAAPATEPPVVGAREGAPGDQKHRYGAPAGVKHPRALQPLVLPEVGLRASDALAQ